MCGRKNGKSDLKEQKLNQRIVQLIQEGETKYRCDHLMDAVLQWICLIILTVSMIGLVYDVAWKYPRYRSNEQQSVRQLQQYREERKRILNGEIVVDTADFTQILKDKASTLKNFPQEEEIYKIKVGTFDHGIDINRNNIFVSDNANVLEQQTKDAIYQLNKQLAVGSDGAQLEIVTVSSLPHGETIESYANKIFNKLGIGNSEKNNGALYLIAINNR